LSWGVAASVAGASALALAAAWGDAGEAALLAAAVGLLAGAVCGESFHRPRDRAEALMEPKPCK
jgi:hypothetical protein